MKLSFIINKPANIIFDYLTDMQKFVSVHPVITKINPIENNTYLVYETLKIGFIPISFTYPVTVESNRVEKTITIRATVMRLTNIEMNFIIKEDKAFCIVEETIHFQSPLPLQSIMESIFKKQHRLLFNNIELLP
ncbi:hypothetical protein GXP67_31035 [Rhodocytophaga rosea]|uniref:SRPBCC family protein n=1 Tax=Rhodocytophaga rosea TaxID=2704465 RepID=A0A6C0GRS0_9BACT|nr:SRPBCC family protein [Rhodocytophaga rosea]QHT70769.1 hypothetical protein GXP67_31035 [Rhodocytophaga rosea]